MGARRCWGGTASSLSPTAALTPGPSATPSGWPPRPRSVRSWDQSPRRWRRSNSGCARCRCRWARGRAREPAAGGGARASSGMAPADLALIIVGTATPDMVFPATACLLQDRLGAKKAGAFDASAACTSWVYGCAMAHGYIAAGLAENVLVVGAETLSRITNWKDRSTCVLFGDSAAAVVLRPAEPGQGFLSFILGADGSGGPLLTLPAGGPRGALARRGELLHPPPGQHPHHRRRRRTAGAAAGEVLHQRRALREHLLRLGAGGPLRGL